MKQFLYKLLIIFLVYFTSTLIADIYLTKRIVSSRARITRVWNELFNGEIQADMIYLGSSKAENDYYPPVFDSIFNIKSYNLGVKGKIFDIDILRYHILKKHNNKQPKYIIWDVYHNTFDTPYNYFDVQFSPYLYDSDVWETVHNEYHNFSIYERYLPLLRYKKNSFIFKYAFDLIFNDTNVIQGYICDESKWNPTNLNSIDDESIVCCFTPESITRFRNTVNEMQLDGSKVILVYSPYYYGGLKKLSLLDSLRTTFKNIAYETNCIYLDFLNDEMCHDTIYFIDANHLNNLGAKVFSKKLAHTLDSLNIIQ